MCDGIAAKRWRDEEGAKNAEATRRVAVGGAVEGRVGKRGRKAEGKEREREAAWRWELKPCRRSARRGDEPSGRRPCRRNVGTSSETCGRGRQRACDGKRARESEMASSPSSARAPRSARYLYTRARTSRRSVHGRARSCVCVNV